MSKGLVCFTGAYGSIECDPDTGNVVNRYHGMESQTCPESSYPEVVRVAITEWKEWCASFGGKWEVGGDILFVGTFNNAGELCEPEQDARNDYVEDVYLPGK